MTSFSRPRLQHSAEHVSAMPHRTHDWRRIQQVEGVEIHVELMACQRGQFPYTGERRHAQAAITDRGHRGPLQHRELSLRRTPYLMGEVIDPRIGRLAVRGPPGVIQVLQRRVFVELHQAEQRSRRFVAVGDGRFRQHDLPCQCLPALGWRLGDRFCRAVRQLQLKERMRRPLSAGALRNHRLKIVIEPVGGLLHLLRGLVVAGQRLLHSRNERGLGHELGDERRDAGLVPRVDTKLPLEKARGALAALQQDDPCFWAVRQHGHPAFPHAVAPVLVRRGVDQDYRAGTPQCVAKLRIERPSDAWRLGRGIGRLKDGYLATRLLGDEAAHHGGDGAIAVLVTDEDERSGRNGHGSLHKLFAPVTGETPLAGAPQRRSPIRLGDGAPATEAMR